MPSETAFSLLKGAIDLHLHSAPDIMPRKADDVEFARRAAAAGMGGILLKSHYVSTADRATLVNTLVPGINVYGAITLNHAVGAINPIAVDIAGRSGARLVWFPTVDAENEMRYQEGNPEGKKPYWYSVQMELRAKGMFRPSFSILDSDGKLKPEVYEVLEVIKAHDMILATGHIGIGEILTLVRVAKEMGVQRILVTHPDFPSIRMPLELQKEAARQGAFLERCYTTPYTGKVSWEEMFLAIRTVGVSSTILSTDLGQPSNPWPVEGFADFFDRLLAAGFREDEIRTMAVVNPGYLVKA